MVIELENVNVPLVYKPSPSTIPYDALIPNPLGTVKEPPMVLVVGVFRPTVKLFEYATTVPNVGGVKLPTTVNPHTVVKDELPPRPAPVL